MWKGNAQRLIFSPSDGMKVQALGTLEVYEPQGKYQLIVTLMRPQGVGDLQKTFEQLKSRLQAEGMFETARKRSLPRFPSIIGIVTSPTGAALQDMKTVAARRWPAAELQLLPVKVQGEGAAQEISRAIDRFNRERVVEVIVVGRGGGSLEDLWAFNEEPVARAIYNSAIPVVSAVGHEVDFTIADFVADLRAPTPSAAMELILPDHEEIRGGIGVLRDRLYRSIQDDLRFQRTKLRSLASHYAFRTPHNLLVLAAQRVDDLSGRLTRQGMLFIQQKRLELEQSKSLLSAYHPQSILERGFSVVFDETHQPVRQASRLKEGSPISIWFAKGTATAEIRKIEPTSTNG